METIQLSQLSAAFEGCFGAPPRLFRSPGRINLIGEHTDYNEGYVLPAAIGRYVYVAMAPRDDGLIRLRSMDFPEAYEGHVDNLAVCDISWANYVLGILHGMQARGLSCRGFDAFFAADLPVGAGLSSSAALCCAAAFGLNALFDWPLHRLEMAELAQGAEHRYAGVLCGIMDPFASLFGREGHFIRLDCRSRAHTYIPFLTEHYQLTLLNTNVKHHLASSAYNQRRQECAQGLAWIQAHMPAASSLREVTMEMIDRYVAVRDETTARRCRYVVAENQRLLQLCEDLQRGDLAAAGAKMYETHAGLSQQYEVSCPEADFLVSHAQTAPAVLGARMMGGGFGGCILALVAREKAAAWEQDLGNRYEDAFGKTLSTLSVHPADGTSEMLI